MENLVYWYFNVLPTLILVLAIAGAGTTRTKAAMVSHLNMAFDLMGAAMSLFSGISTTVAEIRCSWLARPSPKGTGLK